MPNRDALLEAGIACLQDKGYADTKARDVAGRAGVSLGAIGYHFGSTDQLLQAALAEAVRRWLGPLVGLISVVPERFDRERLGPAIDTLIETFRANRPLVLAYFEALLRAEHAVDLRSAMTADFEALHLAVEGGIEQLQAGEPKARRLDPQVSATLVMAVIDGLIVQWLVDPGRLPTGQAIAQTLQLAARLQQAAPRARRRSVARPGRPPGTDSNRPPPPQRIKP